MSEVIAIISEQTSALVSFLCSLVGRASACNAGDLGSIPGWERSAGEGNGNPRQYSCLENSMDREAWQAIVYRVARVGHNRATNTLYLCVSNIPLFTFIRTQSLDGRASQDP